MLVTKRDRKRIEAAKRRQKSDKYERGEQERRDADKDRRRRAEKQAKKSRRANRE